MKRMISNYVEIEIDDSNEWYDKNGLKIQLDTTYEPEKNAQVVGVVTAVPDRLWYDKKNPASMEYDVDMELSVGDRVVFHFLAISNARKEGRVTGNRIILSYSSIYAKLTDSYPKPINGWLLVRPCRKKKEGFLEGVLEEYDVSKTYGLVVGAGAPIREYRIGGFLDPEVPMDSFVHFARQDAIPLFYTIQDRVGELLYRMRRKDVLAMDIDDGGYPFNHMTGRCDG